MLAVTACERQREKRRRVVAVVSMVAVCFVFLASLNMLLRKKFY